MSESGSLVNLGEMAKPATVLIEKVSDAIGTIFEPHQVRRMARANADAAVIEAEGHIRVTEIQRRAMVRFVQEEGNKQENIESITSKAIPHLDEKSTPEAVEDDWIVNFFDRCRIISDEGMQQLWARVLAGEANLPGSFSRRTVNFLASLDKRDAALFSELCSFVWHVSQSTVLVYDAIDATYTSAGINFGSLTHLDAIGLIRFESLAGFRRQQLPKRLIVGYFGTPILLEFPQDEDNEIEIGNVLLTQIGLQLAPIAASKKNDHFFEYVLERWAHKGLCPSTPLREES